jgi:multidrug efflux pump subunit AcrB
VERDRIFVRVDGGYDSAERIRETPITAGGKTFRLGDIAEVKRGYEDPASFVMRHNGKPAVAIGIVMSKGGNNITLGEKLNVEVARLKRELPVGVDIEVVRRSAGDCVAGQFRQFGRANGYCRGSECAAGSRYMFHVDE